jgi:hypothetical protein
LAYDNGGNYDFLACFACFLRHIRAEVCEGREDLSRVSEQVTKQLAWIRK